MSSSTSPNYGQIGKADPILDLWLSGVGLILVAVGYFGPWTPHPTAALTVTGLELAEFAKFFPQVQGGVVTIRRELFYLPLVAIFILLGILVCRSSRRVIRLIGPLGAGLTLVAALLPFSAVEAARHALTTPDSFSVAPDSIRQLVLVLGGALLTLLTPLMSRLSRRVWGGVVASLTLVGLLPALWQFARVRPLFGALYGRPLGLGWGVVVCGVGFGLLLLVGLFGSVFRAHRFL